MSLLPLPGNLLEKIEHGRISAFLEEGNFPTDHQGGFRKGFSTTSTIADLTDDLFTDLNRGETMLSAFIDLKKAFDTVNTNILINKLEEAGIRNNLLSWCKSSLDSWSQRTMVNGQVSTTQRVSCGVPQGSVLGPLFFLIYINDLQNVMEGHKFKLYADDTVLYNSGPNADIAASGLQVSLNRFSQRCSVNKLTINTKKNTKVMSFGSRQRVKRAKHVQVFLNGDKLKKVPTFKYLGMILDSRICLGYDRKSSTDKAHEKAKVPFLSDRRRAHVLNFMYLRKKKTHLLNNREIRTRPHDAPLFNVPIPRCEAFKRSDAIRARWNGTV